MPNPSDLTPEAARKLHRTAEDLGLGPYMPPSQDTPGLGGVPLDLTSYREAELAAWLETKSGGATGDLPANMTAEGVAARLEREEDGIRGRWIVGLDPAGPELPEVKLLRVAPGDVLVFQFPDDALLDLAEVNRTIEALLPDGVTALVLSDAVAITKITPEEADDAQA